MFHWIRAFLGGQHRIYWSALFDDNFSRFLENTKFAWHFHLYVFLSVNLKFTNLFSIHIMIDTSLAILTASNGCHYVTVINSEPFMCALCRSFHLTLKIDLVRGWKKKFVCSTWLWHSTQKWNVRKKRNLQLIIACIPNQRTNASISTWIIPMLNVFFGRFWSDEICITASKEAGW